MANKFVKAYKNTRGFTLVEMILYIAIVSIFLTGLVYFTWDIVYGRVRSFTHQEVNQNMRLVTRRVVYEIRNAKSINSISGNSISLEMADPERNPTVISLSGGRVRIGYGTSGQCPAANACDLTSNKVNVTDLIFTDLSSGNSKNVKFRISIEGVGERKEYQVSETYETSAEIRS